MRPQRNQNIQCPGRLRYLPVQCLEYKPHRRGPRSIRNDQQDLFVPVILRWTRLRDHVSNLVLGEGTTGRCNPG